MSGTIYKITAPCGKAYIGQTWQLAVRLNQYRRGVGDRQPAIANAIKKYSWKSMRISIIARGIQTQTQLDDAEKLAIAKFNTHAPNGYNLSVGGNGGRISPQTRAKIIAGNKGKTRSAQTRKRIGDAQRGKPKSKITRARMAAAWTPERRRAQGIRNAARHSAT